MELIKIARTPAQTWAYNQFEIAREAYRKKLYPEALEALDQAIFGRGDNPGYKLEYRFHFLRGDILLGNAKSLDLSVVDVAAAEESFSYAARYACSEYPQEAAKAFIAAAFAAYVQGKMPMSIEYCEKGIGLNNSIGEGWFQLAKSNINSGYIDKALIDLRNAIDINREYVFRAESDDDFLSYSQEINAFYREIIDQKKIIFHQKLKKLNDKVNKLEKWWEREEKVKDVVSLKSIIKDAINELNTSTILGVYQAIKLIEIANHESNAALKNRKKELNKKLISYSEDISLYIDQNKKLGEAYSKNSYHYLLDEFTTLTQQISIPTTFNQYHIKKKKLTEIFNKIKKVVHGNAKKAKTFFLATVTLMAIIYGPIGGCLGWLAGYFLGYVLLFIKGGLILNSTTYCNQHIDTMPKSTALICGLIGLCIGILAAIIVVSCDHKPLKKHTE
jgi:tetratricopeptide (TPR) repeat protein